MPDARARCPEGRTPDAGAGVSAAAHIRCYPPQPMANRPDSRFVYEEFDLSDVKTYPLASRASKARAEDFARPYAAGSGVAGAPRFAARHPGGRRLQSDRRSHGRRPPARRRHHLGLRRARRQDGAVAHPRGPDGPRVRVCARHQRRRDHPRLRGRALGSDFGGRRRGARARAASGWRRRPGGC